MTTTPLPEQVCACRTRFTPQPGETPADYGARFEAHTRSCDAWPEPMVTVTINGREVALPASDIRRQMQYLYEVRTALYDLDVELAQALGLHYHVARDAYDALASALQAVAS